MEISVLKQRHLDTRLLISCYSQECALIVGDEVGGILKMTRDNHSGGQLFLTDSKQVPYQQVSTTEKNLK